MRRFFLAATNPITCSASDNLTRSTYPSSLLAVLLFVSPLVSAAELPSFTEADLIADIPLVVSATRRSQKLTEAPASITIIDREQIEASGAINIPDLFRLVPGIQAYHVTRNKFAVTYHGVSDDFPNRMEVMVDGRSIYIPLLSTVVWEAIGIEIDDIDHIEVVRGSNVPTQGSNAFLGSINIVTRSALSPERSSANLMTGNRNEQRGRFQHSVLGESGYARLAGGFSRNDGGTIYEDDAHNSYINLNGSLTLSLRDTLEVRAGFSSGQYDVVGADLLSHVATPRDHDANYQHLIWNHEASDESEFKLSFYHNYLKLNVDAIPAEEWLARELDIPLNTATIFAAAFGIDGTSLRPDSEHGRTDLYDLELQYNYYPSESLSLTSGMGYRYARALSDVLLDSDDWISEEHTRLFGNLQWNQSAKAVWNLGAMYELSSLAQPSFSPRLAFNYLFDKDSSIRIAHTRAFRVPSLLEHNSAYNIRTNATHGYAIVEQISSAPESLKAERISSTEIGFYTRQPWRDIQFDVRLFHENIDNGINTYFLEADPAYGDTNNSRSTKANTQQWESNGLEFQLKARPSPSSLAVFNYGLINTAGSYDRNKGLLRDMQHYTPQDTASLLLSYTFTNQWQLSAAHYFMGTTRWLEGTSHNPRKAYRRTDLQIRTQLPLSAGLDIEVRGIIQNLFDDRYQEFYDYNLFDRRAYLEVKLLF